MQSLSDSVTRLTLLSTVRSSLLSPVGSELCDPENADPNAQCGPPVNPTAKSLRDIESAIEEMEGRVCTLQAVVEEEGRAQGELRDTRGETGRWRKRRGRQ